MRRHTIAAVVLLALCATAVPATSAAAGDTPRYCAPVEKAVNAISDIDVSDLDRVSAAFDRAATKLRKAARRAPADLRAPIRKVADVFEEAAELDAEDITEIVELAVDTQEDFELHPGAHQDCVRHRHPAGADLQLNAPAITSPACPGLP